MVVGIGGSGDENCTSRAAPCFIARPAIMLLFDSLSLELPTCKVFDKSCGVSRCWVKFIHLQDPACFRKPGSSRTNGVTN